MQIISGEEFAEKETEKVIKILGLVRKMKEMKFDWRSMRGDFHSDLLMILLR